MPHLSYMPKGHEINSRDVGYMGSGAAVLDLNLKVHLQS